MRDITLRSGNTTEINIRIDERQSIRDTLMVLVENGKIYPINDLQKVYSMRKKQYVNIGLTYEQAGIYNGDRLVIKK